MARLTVEDLNALREKLIAEAEQSDIIKLLICGGTGCHATGSIPVLDALEKEIGEKGLGDKFQVVETGCNGFCAMGPILVVHPEGVFYQKLSAEDVPELVEEHLINGRHVERLLYKEPGTKNIIPLQNDIPFFGNQMPRALRNKGLIDPEKIDDYIARDGYAGERKRCLKCLPKRL